MLPRRIAHAAGLALILFLPAAMIAAPVNAGMTTVTFDTGTLSVLTGAGFSIAPVSPATLATSPSVSASFPIIGGDTSSMILHSGGLALTKSGTTVDLENFIINVNTSTLSGQVIVGSSTMNNVSLFTLSSINGTTALALSSALSGAINQVYGVNLPAGTPIGTAVVTATPEPTSLAMAGIALLGGLAALRKKKSA